MRKLTILLFAISFMGTKAQKMPLQNPSGPIAMVWLEHQGMKHAALLIPVKLPSDTTEYYMQLDFGATTTVFYQNAPQSKTVYLGASLAQLDQIQLVSLAYNTANKIIGTLGMDLLSQTKIELNFKEGLIFLNSKTMEEAKAPFHFVRNKIIFPASLNGEQKMLLYDSGSSAFDLITDAESWETFRLADADTRSFKANSWGKEMTIYLAPANLEVEIGGADLAITQVAYVEGMSSANQANMKSTGMQGMIGNTLFLDKIIYLDFQSKRFGIAL